VGDVGFVGERRLCNLCFGDLSGILCQNYMVNWRIYAEM